MTGTPLPRSCWPAVRLVATAALVATTFCLPILASSQVIHHPTKENIPTAVHPRFELRPRGNEAGRWSWEGLDTETIGVREGDAHEMIGILLDLDTDRRGTLFYLDMAWNEVRSYAYDGTYRGSIGSQGEGPGEFKGVTSLTVADQGRTLFVNDGGIVTRFERDGGSTTFVSEFRAPPLGFGSCAMHGYYYTMGHDPTRHGIVHKITYGGDVVLSFGEPYKHTTAWIAERFAMEGLLACNERHRIIAQITKYIPAMTAYSESGELLWQVTFPEFRQYTVAERVRSDGRTVRSVLTENGRAEFKALFSDEDSFYVAYNIVDYDLDNKIMPDIIHKESHLFRIDARTGIGVYLGPAGPELGEHIVAVDGEYRFTESGGFNKFSQIHIYRSR